VIDPIQRRLQEEFRKLEVTYQLRRGVSRRKSSDVHYERLGPFLSAFYGDPISTHKNKAELFENERRYRHLFAEDTHVKNLLFVYHLGNSVALTKAMLKDAIAEGKAGDDDKQKFEYFRYGAFSFVVMHVVAEVLGLWLSAHQAGFKRRVTVADKLLFDQAQCDQFLSQFVYALLGPIHMFLRNKDAYQILKIQDGVADLAAHVKTIIEQVHTMRPDIYSGITAELVLL
jgi:hypothetical protein